MAVATDPWPVTRDKTRPRCRGYSSLGMAGQERHRINSLGNTPGLDK